MVSGTFSDEFRGGKLTGADTEFRKRGSASNFGRKTARGSWGAL